MRTKHALPEHVALPRTAHMNHLQADPGLSKARTVSLPHRHADLSAEELDRLMACAEERMASVAVDHWQENLSKYPCIDVNPWINHGRPTIKGTRIPVSVIVSYLAGPGVDGLLIDYPKLNRDTILQAIGFAIDTLGG